MNLGQAQASIRDGKAASRVFPVFGNEEASGQQSGADDSMSTGNPLYQAHAKGMVEEAASGRAKDVMVGLEKQANVASSTWDQLQESIQPTPRLAALDQTQRVAQFKEELRGKSGNKDLKRLEWLLCLCGMARPNRAWLCHALLVLVVNTIRIFATIALVSQGGLPGGELQRQITSLGFKTLCTMTQAIFIWSFHDLDLASILIRLWGDQGDKAVGDLGAKIGRSFRWFLPMCLFVAVGNAGGVSGGAAADCALDDPYYRLLCRTSVAPLPGSVASVYLLLPFLAMQPVQLLTAFFVFAMSANLLHGRYRSLAERISAQELDARGIWDEHKHLCRITKKVDFWFRHYTTTFMAVNVTILLYCINYVLYVRSLPQPDRPVMTGVYIWTTINALLIGVFLRYGLRVMEWHHRLLEAVTSIDEAKLMQRRKAPADGEYLTISPTYLVARLSAHTPGFTLLWGMVRLRKQVIYTFFSMASSVFILMYRTSRQGEA